MRKLQVLGAMLVLVGPCACGGGELASRWLSADPAMVRCTSAGRDRMPPVLLDLPVPAVPSGLLARQLDPMALNDMGFAREQPVCAALMRPTAEAIDVAREEIDALLRVHGETGAAVRGVLGRCACEAARAADLVDLVAPCRDEPHQPSCSTSAEELERVQEIIAPLQAALSATPVPRVHWRVAGRSDRPGWIVRRIAELLPRHAGGATVFQEGQAIPSRHNHVLVRRLLDVPGVSAVLRLDGGRSLLVIREIEGALVLDLFAFPEVDPKLVSLLPFIDEARANDVIEALARPPVAWVPPLPFDEGNFVHLDRDGLDAVDSMLLAMAPLAGLRGAPRSLDPPENEPRVDAVTLQARFGSKGKALRVRLKLSDAGQTWAQALGSQLLASDLDGLGLPSESPPRPPPAATSLDLIAHRTPTEYFVLDGLVGAAAFMRRLEMQHPNSLAGGVDAWKVELPPGAVGPGGTVPPAEELRAWAERIAAEPYRLESSFDPRRETLELELAPR